MTNVRIASFALITLMGISAAHAASPCRDCDSTTGLTARETIKLQQAKDAQRVAEDPKTRPWDGMYLTGPKTGTPKPGTSPN